MTLLEKVKQIIFKTLGMKKLPQNPNDDRYTYLGNPDIVQKQKIQEYKYWYYGDANELLNYYTSFSTYGASENPIYNRNRTQFFWGINSMEFNIKRVHSGLPHAMISTLVSIIGTPLIQCAEKQEVLDKIINKCSLYRMMNQQQMPLTLALGDGAFKPIIDKAISDTPLVEYYEAEDVEFVVKHGVIVAFVFKDYYNYKKRDYVLMETRGVRNQSSYIEYKLYRLEKDNQVTEVELSTIPELAELEGFEIKGYDKPLAVASVFFYDDLNKNRGRSVFAGKIGLFDDLDQSLSQRSQTCRVSTPVEYYPVDLLERTPNGKTILPSVYNRQYIQKDSTPNGDGVSDGQIQTTQPNLNFEQYNEEQISIVNMILTGYMSPASFGIDVSRKDNADAQREKEKVTIMTRDNVIDAQTEICKLLCSQLLMLQEYMDTEQITLQDYNISVKFNDFANPSFENLSQVLTPMWTQGAISTKMFVEKLYGDSLSNEEKQREIEELDKQRNKDNIDLGAFEYENQTPTNSNIERTNEEATRNIAE